MHLLCMADDLHPLFGAQNSEMSGIVGKELTWPKILQAATPQFNRRGAVQVALITEVLSPLTIQMCRIDDCRITIKER